MPLPGSPLAPDDPTAVEVAYLAVLTRRPTPEEAAHFAARLAGPGDERNQRMTDLTGPCSTRRNSHGTIRSPACLGSTVDRRGFRLAAWPGWAG